MAVVVRVVVGAEVLAAVVLVEAAADSAVVDSVAALADPAVAVGVSAAAAQVGVGRPKDLFASIRSTRKLRWLRQ